VPLGLISVGSFFSFSRARIYKFLRSPRVDSKEPIPSAYVAWRAGTTTPICSRFLAPTDSLKIPAQKVIAAKKQT
jgi:hypothetical protein